MIIYDKIGSHSAQDVALKLASRNLSYGELVKLTDNLASYFVERGVREGDRLMLLGGDAEQMLPVFLAASRLGLGLVYPMDLEVPKVSELKRILDHAKPDWLVVENAVVLDAEQHGDIPSDRVISLQSSYKENDAEIPRPTQPHTAFIAIYNSIDVQNGEPRAACFTESGFVSCAESIGLEMQLESPACLLMNGFLCTLIGEVLSLSSLMSGGTLAILDPRKGEQLRDQVQGSGATHLMLPPSVLATAFKELTLEEAQNYYSRVRLIAYGAAPADAKILTRAQKLIGCQWVHGYGQTQTGGPIIWLRDAERRKGQGGVGTATSGLEVALIKSDGSVAGTGETGEIGVRGVQVFAGYWDPEKKTPIAPPPLPGGWHRTMDLGQFDQDGNLQLRGRVRNVVLRADGYTVNCDEVEATLKAATSIENIALVPWKPEGTADEVAVLVFSSTSPRKDIRRLRAAASKLLSQKKNPDFLMVISNSQFDRNTIAAKITKNKLVKMQIPMAQRFFRFFGG